MLPAAAPHRVKLAQAGGLTYCRSRVQPRAQAEVAADHDIARAVAGETAPTAPLETNIKERKTCSYIKD